MPWVKFTDNFDWQPEGARWMLAFRKGHTILVKQEVASKAIEQGKAVPAVKPEKRNKENASR